MAVKFAVITNHRSGSSFFMRSLNSHPQINARQEDLRRKQDRTKKFLDELYGGDQPYAFGSKIMYTHINQQVQEWLIDSGIILIQFIRLDLLETIFWNNYFLINDPLSGGFGPPLTLKKPNVKFDIKKVDYLAAQLKELKADIDYWHEKVDMVVTYENDMTDGGKNTKSFYNLKTRKEISELLNVDDRRLYDSQTKQQKNDRGRMVDVVENYYELINGLHQLNAPMKYKL